MKYKSGKKILIIYLYLQIGHIPIQNCLHLPFKAVYWNHSMLAVKFWISLREFFSPSSNKNFSCHCKRKVEVEYKKKKLPHKLDLREPNELIEDCIWNWKKSKWSRKGQKLRGTVYLVGNNMFLSTFYFLSSVFIHIQNKYNVHVHTEWIPFEWKKMGYLMC